MSEYHKIETLYERDEKTFKIKPELILKNRVYGLLKSWQWTEKIDGTNIRVIYQKDVWNKPTLSFGGRTDNAQIHADLIKYLYETFDKIRLAEVFPEIPDCGIVLYGEGYGAGIKKKRRRSVQRHEEVHFVRRQGGRMVAIARKHRRRGPETGHRHRA